MRRSFAPLAVLLALAACADQTTEPLIEPGAEPHLAAAAVQGSDAITFSIHQSVALPTLTGSIVYAGLLDGDEFLDVVVLDYYGQKTRVYEDEGGVLVLRAELPAFRGVWVADTDGDGRPEIAAAYWSRLHIWEASGDNTYTQRYVSYLPGTVENIRSGDSDDDERGEFIIALESAGLYLLEAVGDNTWQRAAHIRVLGGDGYTVGARDLNLNGKSEVVFWDGSSRRTGPNRLHVFEHGVETYTDLAVQMILITLADTDGDGLGEIVGYDPANYALKILESDGGDGFGLAYYGFPGFSWWLLTDVDNDGRSEFFRLLKGESGAYERFELAHRQGDTFSTLYDSGSLLEGKALRRILALGEFGGERGFMVTEDGWLHVLLAAAADATLLVDLDVMPESDGNPINVKARGVTPVAVLGSDELDPGVIDVSTLRFGTAATLEAGAGAAPAHPGGHREDVNGDGTVDLLLHFPTRDTGIACGDTEVRLAGMTSDGLPLEGADVIRTTGCRRR